MSWQDLNACVTPYEKLKYTNIGFALKFMPVSSVVKMYSYSNSNFSVYCQKRRIVIEAFSV
jgi:hypothetical protein